MVISKAGGKKLIEKVKLWKEKIKWRFTERKQKIELGVARDAAKVTECLKKARKEMVRNRNDLYFVVSGILGSVGICVSMNGKGKGNCEKANEQMQAMVTALALSTPNVRLTTFNMLLTEWNSSSSDEQIKMIRRLMKIYCLGTEEWLSDLLLSVVTSRAFSAYKSLMPAAHEGNGIIFNKIILPFAGFLIHPGCLQKFEELKTRKTGYIVFKVDREAKRVVVENIGMATDNFIRFSKAIPDKECRYAVIGFQFDGQTKFLFIQWVPRASEFGSQLIYSGLKKVLKAELEGVIEVESADVGLVAWKYS